MIQRKGLGKGSGKRGYYNLMPMDSHIHSLSAKGVKTYQGGLSKNIINSYTGKDYLQNREYVFGYFGSLSRDKQKDRIIERFLIKKGFSDEDIAFWMASRDGRYFMDGVSKNMSELSFKRHLNKWFKGVKKRKSLFAKGKKVVGKANPTYQEMKSLATDIEKFLKKNDLLTDTRIYFKGKAWDYDSSGNKKVINAKASNYFEYANDKTLSMSFEGGLYDVMEGYNGEYGWKLEEQFSKILEKHGYYYERGNAWNIALYPTSGETGGKI